MVRALIASFQPGVPPVTLVLFLIVLSGAFQSWMIAGYWLPQACSNSANAAPRPQRCGGVDLAQVLADLLQYFDAYRSEARARCTDETVRHEAPCDRAEVKRLRRP